MKRCSDTAFLPENPHIDFEKALWSHGLGVIAGLDEAGRGAWAGPVAAAAVVLPPDDHILVELLGVKDSKQLSPSQRSQMAILIKEKAAFYAVSWADNKEIDAMGILQATRLAMMRALSSMNCIPDHLLIDALFLPDISCGQTSLIKGDRRSLSIAAASILAKTARDALMIEMSIEFKGFSFDKHKGYGTRQHQKELADSGPCETHRMTFRPVSLIQKQ